MSIQFISISLCEKSLLYILNKKTKFILNKIGFKSCETNFIDEKKKKKNISIFKKYVSFGETSKLQFDSISSMQVMGSLSQNKNILKFNV